MQTQQAMTKTHKGRGRSGKPKPLTILMLWTKSGGRCALCNQYLLRDSLTLKQANLSNVGHIVAAAPDGPRGNYPLPMERRHDLDNLILVCPQHHKLFDTDEHVDEYPVKLLREIKQRHEARIERLTACHPDNKTTVLRFRANFDHGQPVDAIHKGAIEEAILPRYMQDDKGVEIDLTALSFDTTPEYWRTAKREIKRRLRGLCDPTVLAEPVRHLSVFALGPIPLLVALGHELPSSVQTDVFQRHICDESWTWKPDGPPVGFRIDRVSAGPGDRAVVLLSVSGTIDRTCIPEDLQDCSLYELSPADETPLRGLIQRRADVEAFRAAYQQLLGQIRNDNPRVSDIDLFAAVPAPLAVICGKELLRKVHPVVHVYEFDRKLGRYTHALQVNDHDSD